MSDREKHLEGQIEELKIALRAIAFVTEPGRAPVDELEDLRSLARLALSNIETGKTLYSHCYVSNGKEIHLFSCRDGRAPCSIKFDHAIRSSEVE